MMDHMMRRGRQISNSGQLKEAAEIDHLRCLLSGQRFQARASGRGRFLIPGGNLRRLFGVCRTGIAEIEFTGW